MLISNKSGMWARMSRGETPKGAHVDTFGDFQVPDCLATLERPNEMNVIDIRTGRPVGEPAPFIAHFEIIDEPCRRRQAPADMVGMTAIVSQRAAFRLATFASEQIGVTTALRSAVVSAIRPNMPTPLADVAPCSITLQPEPGAGAGAWLFSAELSRQSIGALARLALELGAYEERRLAS